MPNLSSSIGTTQPYIPAVNKSQLGRFAGLQMQFETLTALNAAVVLERSNIAVSSGLWSHHQIFTVSTESVQYGVYRVWDITGQHARTISLAPGKILVLQTDSNTLLTTTGVPNSNVGINGDVAADWTANLYYVKSSGVWGAGLSIGTSQGIQAQVDAIIADLATINRSPIALPDQATLPDTSLTASGNILANDSDANSGDTLEITEFLYRGVDKEVGSSFQTIYGNMFLQPTGDWIYTVGPGARALTTGQTATEVFEYTIGDGHGGIAKSTLTVIVQGTNNVPVATDDHNKAPINTTITGNVLTNDYDYESTPLSVIRFEVIGYGSFEAAGVVKTITGIGTFTVLSNGNYTFIPVADYVGPVPPIKYTLTDGVNNQISYLSLAIVPGIETTVPIVLYTGVSSGPLTGGEDNMGAYLQIFGKNFGNFSDLGTNTKVFIGGHEVAKYMVLSQSKVSAMLGIQRLIVQVGALGGATLGVPIDIQVRVNGVYSNASCTFTPNPGRMIYVSLSGDDSTAVPGDITKPFRHLQLPSRFAGGVYPILTAGDQVVVRGGDWSDLGFQTAWFRFRDASAQGSIPTGAPNTGWINFMAYPGEDVHYSTPVGGNKGGFQGPGMPFESTTGEYVGIFDFRMDVPGGSTGDAAPVNMQYTGGRWRIVNNDLGPWVAGASPVLNAAAITGKGREVFIYGNRLHHIEGTAELQNHGIYAGTATYDWDVGYNWIHDITGGSHIQFNDSDAGTGVLNTPEGLWMGFTLCRIHHNWLEQCHKYGIVFADLGYENSTTAGTLQAQIWNNVFIGSKLPPIRFYTHNLSTDVLIAFNTIYDGMTQNSGTGNGLIRNDGVIPAPNHKVRVYDNILAIGTHTIAQCEYFSSATTQVGGSTGFDFKRNLYFAGGQSPANTPSILGDTSPIEANPMFTNGSIYDLTLQAGSPAINAATQAMPAGFIVTDDFTCTATRQFGGAADIGAYEYPQTTPYLIANPVITGGTPQANVQLTTTNGTWGNTPTSPITRQWRVAGSPVGTGTTYTPTGSQVGLVLSCDYTAINGAGSSTVTLVIGTIALGAAAPVFTSDPAITGSAVIGQTLTASPASATGTIDSRSYQWRRGNSDISGQTSTTYVVTSLDVGNSLTVRETLNNSVNGNVSRISNALGPVSAPPADPVVVQFKSAPLVSNTIATVTLDNPVVQGNLILLVLGGWDNAPHNFAYGDNRGNPTTADWSYLTSQLNNNPNAQLYYARAKSSGTYTVGIQPYAIVTGAVTVIEVGPCDEFTTFDLMPQQSITLGTTSVTLTADQTTTKSNDLVVTYYVSNNNPTLTPTPGALLATPARPTSYFQTAVVVQKLSSIVTPSVTTTFSTASNVCATMVVIKGS